MTLRRQRNVSLNLKQKRMKNKGKSRNEFNNRMAPDRGGAFVAGLDEGGGGRANAG
jgi:hypothetical protein